MYLLEITTAARADDLYLESDSLDALLIDSLRNSQLYSVDDGYRIFELPGPPRNGLLADFVEPAGPPSGFEYLLDTVKQNGVAARETHATKAAAQAAIAALDPSDGYAVYASWDGDGGARRFERRITLWRWTPAELDTAPPTPVASRANQHNRLDTDRF